MMKLEFSDRFPSCVYYLVVRNWRSPDSLFGKVDRRKNYSFDEAQQKFLEVWQSGLDEAVKQAPECSYETAKEQIAENEHGFLKRDAIYRTVNYRNLLFVAQLLPRRTLIMSNFPKEKVCPEPTYQIGVQNMARNKKHADGAAKQRAYRQRKAREKRNAHALLLKTNPSEEISAPTSSKPSRPPVRYYGGKWRIAPWIIDYFPPHVTYLEPYCGGASILFRKEPSKFEIINDLNGEVVNFFDVLRSRPDELVKMIQLTSVSREEHRRAHRLDTDDPLERARRFYVRSRQSFGSGEGEYNTGWRYQANSRRGTSVVDEWNMTDHLYEAARRLKLVQIECDDAIRTIERFDSPETLHYVDPPYLFSTRYSSEARYAHELSDQQHKILAELLHSVEGMVMISGYGSELYSELYKDWRCVSKHTRTNGNNPSIEYLWISPRCESAGLPLFQQLSS